MSFLSAHIDTEPIWRGGEQQVLYLLQGLERRGYPVVLFAAPGTLLQSRAKERGIDTYDLTIRSDADLGAVLRLRRHLKRLRPAVVHMHTSHAHPIGVLASRLASRWIKRVVSRRVDFSIYRHSFLRLNWIKYRWGVDKYLAVSGRVKEVLVDDGLPPEKIGLVYDGVDPDRFKDVDLESRPRLMKEWRLPHGLPLVGSVGALVGHKGFTYFVDAAVEVLKHRDCAFAIIGEGALYGELERKIHDLRIEHRFRLVGFRSDIGDVLRAFDVYVSSSVEEGLGSSLLDALLLNRPCVATRAGGSPEIIQDHKNGLLVQPGNGPALAAGIEELLSDPVKAQRLAAEGHRTAMHEFHVDCMVERTIDAYEQLVGDGIKESIHS
jgi:glycosyltransferase involved in cell wall biosynthesis